MPSTSIVCNECGHHFINKVGTIHFNSKVIGDVEILNIFHLKCANPKCTSKFLPMNSAGLVSREVRRKEKEAISKLPITEFACFSEASYLLGISEYILSQQLGKFVWTKLGRNYYIHRKSIQTFLTTGDGRFNIMEGKHV